MAVNLRSVLRLLGLRGSLQPVILRYHRVADLDADPQGLAVSPGFFAEHLEILRARYRPMMLRDLVRGLRDGTRTRHGVVLTFDDGYVDNLLAARPQLERFNIPATVFITTGYVGAGREYLSAEDVRRLAEGRLVEIGAHSVTHPAFRGLAPARQREEISTSKAVLEGILGEPVTSFAYPYGQSARTMTLVKQAGFESACTTVADVVGRGQDPYRLPRFKVGNWDGDRFARQLSALIKPHD